MQIGELQIVEQQDERLAGDTAGKRIRDFLAKTMPKLGISVPSSSRRGDEPQKTIDWQPALLEDSERPFDGPEIGNSVSARTTHGDRLEPHFPADSFKLLEQVGLARSRYLRKEASCEARPATGRPDDGGGAPAFGPVGSAARTGFMKRYPRPRAVWMKAGASTSSSRAVRMLMIARASEASVTTASDQTRSKSSSFEMTMFGRSTR
jgi:hypothetical protein